MNKKIKFGLLGMAFVFTTCIFTGCKNKTVLDEQRDLGNIISVSYDANGGSYFNRDGITIIDMINPNNYDKDSNGVTKIKLVNPLDPKRKAGGSEGIYLTKTDNFLVGWYKNKELRKNTDGKVVDENNNPLVLLDNNYYLEEDQTTAATPAYDYSGYWDFNTSTIDYTDDMGQYDLTLYAVWSSFFEFNYYYEQEDGTWKECGTTTFDYVTTNQAGSTSADRDTIWLPTWKDGAMNYSFKYSDNKNYKFPKIDGYTFKNAYLDSDKTNLITDSYEHTGSLDLTTGKAVNRVQNIYITLDKGELYKISNATQFVNNASLDGIYEINNDLDFAGLSWPTIFSLGTFNGSIKSANSTVVSFKNISIKHNNASALNGGAFGVISANATIENVKFEDITFDISYAGRRLRNTNFGIFAGLIEDNATLTNVSVSGTMKIGAITLGDDYSVNLIANGNISNITELNPISLIIYGEAFGDKYSYTVNPYPVDLEGNPINFVDEYVDEFGNVTLVFVTSLKLDEAQVLVK